MYTSSPTHIHQLQKKKAKLSCPLNQPRRCQTLNRLRRIYPTAKLARNQKTVKRSYCRGFSCRLKGHPDYSQSQKTCKSTTATKASKAGARMVQNHDHHCRSHALFQEKPLLVQTFACPTRSSSKAITKVDQGGDDTDVCCTPCSTTIKPESRHILPITFLLTNAYTLFLSVSKSPFRQTV